MYVQIDLWKQAKIKSKWQQLQAKLQHKINITNVSIYITLIRQHNDADLIRQRKAEKEQKEVIYIQQNKNNRKIENFVVKI